ncbi:MAG: hypothetical protein RL007_559 [Bacteroidota bacterium]
MRASLLVSAFAALSLLTSSAFAQTVQSQSANHNTNCPGVPGACGYPNNPSVQSVGPQNPTPQNGNGTLGVIYDMQKCGLDYTSASQRLGRRGSLAGVLQPAPFNITGIPACAVIERAYLWAEGSGNGAAQTATLAGPFGTQAFPMTIVGQGPDKCWGYSGSYTYRADVTAIVQGNGVYNISGILTNPPTAGNDMDGATLLVVWSLPTANWAGRIVIADGAIIVNGGVGNYNMPINPAVCGATNSARAFFGVGDIQFNPTSWSANGTAIPPSWNWWNFMQTNTAVATGATTSNFNINTGGDCFNLCIAGLYFRTTTCTTCPSAAAVTVTPTTVPATCSNCNGSATVTVAPSGTYTYSWAPSGGNAATATGLCPGTYTVTITQTPCITTTQTVTITNNGGAIAVANTTQTNVSCFGGNNGSITTTASGGTSPYTFTWSPAVTNTTTGNSNTATGLTQGTYVVTATDASGCTGTQTFTITQPTQVTSTSLINNVLCFGGSSGSADITGAGGTGPYTFAWSPAATNNTTGNTNTGTGLSAQAYSIIVTDANGCSTTQNITVTEPPVLTASASSIATSCNQANGSVDVISAGGTGATTVLWNPGGYTTNTVNNLAAGTYSVTVTDVNGCTAIDTITVSGSANMTTTTSFTDLLCFNDNSGTASVTVTGNTGTVTYVWTPNVSTTNSATGLAAGTYVIDANDPNGCSTTSTITITEPPQLTNTVGGFNVSCYGVCDGQVVVIPAGGTGTYTFNWNSGCTQPSCNSVCAGTYNVTVTDANGCTTTGTTTVTEPPQILINTSWDTAHCGQADGNAYASASGGSGGLTYMWLPNNVNDSTLVNVTGGNYDVVVTDANGCADTVTVNVYNQQGVVATMGPLTHVLCFGGSDGTAAGNYNGGNGPYTYSWSPSGGTGSSASSLSAGSYVVTVTDADGCTSSATAIITEPSQLNLQATATPTAVCEGTPVTLNATPGGGTPNYSVVWSPGNLAGNSQTIIPPVTGTYTADVTDLNGCTATATVVVTVNPVPTAALSGDTLAGCATLCVNFSDMTAIASGTITNWLWDFGDQNTSLSQNPSHCYATAGLYSVSLSVISAAGCTNTITMTNYVDVYGIPTAAFSANPQPTTELNPTIYFTDLSIGANAWTWSFGDLSNASSTLQNPSFEYPGPGCYDVVLEVESSNGCTDTAMQEICIDPDVAIFVPNTFTPNEDGSNDVFFPQGVGIDPDQFEMWIFDRWGNLIYYTEDMNDGWNGTVQGKSGQLCQVDTYVWKIKCVDMLGKKHNMLGHVNLIR